jgi:hypothetical protein
VVPAEERTLAADLTASVAEKAPVPARAAGLSTETLGRREDTLRPTGRAVFVLAHSAVTSVADRREAPLLAEAPVWAAGRAAGVSVVAGMPVAEVTAVAGIIDRMFVYVPGGL